MTDRQLKMFESELLALLRRYNVAPCIIAFRNGRDLCVRGHGGDSPVGQQLAVSQASVIRDALEQHKASIIARAEEVANR